MASPSSFSSRFEELPPSPTSSTHSFHSTDDFDQSTPEPPPPSTSSTTTARAQPNPSTREQAKPSTSEGEPLGQDENDEEDDDDPDHDHDDSDILDRSSTFKTRGNTLFGKGQWQEALDCYREGLVELPVRTKPGVKIVKGKQKEEQKQGEEQSNSAENILDGVDKLNLEEEPVTEAEQESDPEEVELVELRSVLFANVAACCLKMERWKEAVEACDEALEEKPKYMKALHRRALANEQLGTWSSLTSALEDYTALSALPDLSPSFKQQIKSAQTRLTPLAKAQQEKEQAEMMGKLKDLGNTVLGKFGLSTENFKFVEQPGGGYSMNFQR
ncbi:BZ3500_MvSof-1268-A1-R1_Chr7-1g09185 [Microbotryum saponariae]|uniref:BZ3500_MvSof-1268-A1-R1_Chr7-1g09185 protein n=1 Tax=Microbotryum saponariae TaxID=289078 RepID=A0A2X0N1S3_9BASI|nr:BZ3501_MvSof-1269-A2-R1_Chr7-1g08890 [Microbotryum saponariae]SDA02958.1 BZ3500_MvSof-1268-A1-R1_Chr7-1g09185 [Microbotryum saponariae]